MGTAHVKRVLAALDAGCSNGSRGCVVPASPADAVFDFSESMKGEPMAARWRNDGSHVVRDPRHRARLIGYHAAIVADFRLGDQ